MTLEKLEAKIDKGMKKLYAMEQRKAKALNREGELRLKLQRLFNKVAVLKGEAPRKV